MGELRGLIDTFVLTSPGIVRFILAVSRAVCSFRLGLVNDRDLQSTYISTMIWQNSQTITLLAPDKRPHTSTEIDKTWPQTKPENRPDLKPNLRIDLTSQLPWGRLDLTLHLTR